MKIGSIGIRTTHTRKNVMTSCLIVGAGASMLKTMKMDGANENISHGTSWLWKNNFFKTSS